MQPSSDLLQRLVLLGQGPPRKLSKVRQIHMEIWMHNSQTISLHRLLSSMFLSESFVLDVFSDWKEANTAAGTHTESKYASPLQLPHSYFNYEVELDACRQTGCFALVFLSLLRLCLHLSVTLAVALCV